MSDFPNPNIIKPYMTIVHGRRPVTKLHSSLGHAKNALLMYGSKYNTVRGGDLYEWRGDIWERLYSIPENSPESAIPWKRTTR